MIGITKIISIIYFLGCLLTNGNYAQSSSDSAKVNTERLILVGGIYTAALSVSYALQDNIWWKGERSGFHFNWKEDWNTNLGADKLGHFYFSYLTANILAQAFEYSGLDAKYSKIYGGIGAMVHQTFTEIRDGFSTNYGFSAADYSFNLLGAFFPLLQNEYKYLNAVSFKISYYPSDRFTKGSNNYLIDDYESTYNWLSIDVNKLLPKQMDDYFPDFINLAIGHSVKQLDYRGVHEFYIGIDWDLEALPGESDFLKFLKKNLNFYHFPSPVVKIYPNVIWYGLKF
jgi:hypothetical protein